MSPNALLAFLAASCGAALALAVMLRSRQSLAGRCFCVGMILFAFEALSVGVSFNQTRAEGIAFWQDLALATRSVLPGFWLCFSLAYARGNHRELFSKWRPALVLTFLVPITILGLFRNHLITVLPYEPSQQGWWLSSGSGVKALDVFFLVATVLVLMNLERTLRSAVGTTRWRIKFLILGLAIILAAKFYVRTQALLFSGHDLALTTLGAGALLLGSVFMSVGCFRSGFAEIDVYPSHAVLHTSVTVVLAGIYLFAVGVLAQLVAHFGGAVSFHLQAFLVLVGVAILAVLLLSERIRQRIQSFVSRHFKRPQHDLRLIWTRLTRSMSAVLDEAGLCLVTSRLISENFNALAVSIWLFDQPQGRFERASSTAHVEADPAQLSDSPGEVNALEFASVAPNKLSRPFDLERAKDEWTTELKEATAGRFKEGGNRICIPLVAGEHRLGVIVLADRVGGIGYTAEEMDLLKCIGDQVAANLLNIALTKEQMAGKELEAFQTISAFFIHDLKNAASTLSLMLQNLPAHFDDPLFRQDALRGIGSTADRINQLISRLGALRHEPQLQLSEVDLNLLVMESLKNLNGAPGQLITRLGPVPRVLGDVEQLRGVLTNLLLNACDAIDQNGQIIVETRPEEGWVTWSVSDNGCGMSPAFMKDSLFKPFRTTKKKGLGIGMFQAKIIIEAHHGKIQIKSEVGTGTSVHVMLPQKSADE